MRPLRRKYERLFYLCVNASRDVKTCARNLPTECPSCEGILRPSYASVAERMKNRRRSGSLTCQSSLDRATTATSFSEGRRRRRRRQTENFVPNDGGSTSHGPETSHKFRKSVAARELEERAKTEFTVFQSSALPSGSPPLAPWQGSILSRISMNFVHEGDPPKNIMYLELALLLCI